MRLLSSLLSKVIQKGTLRLVDAGGRVHRFGGKSPGPSVTLRLHDRALHTKLALNPELHIGDAYMNGTLTFEEGSGVGDLIYLFSLNRGGLAAHGW
jgi:cyclopropane-fatty-acyl-phospholipid synthase